VSAAEVVADAAAAGEAGARPRVRTVHLALAGCGVVGGELVRLLRASAAEVRERHGVRFELARVLVRDPRKPRPAGLGEEVLTTDVEEFLAAAAAADVVVEAVGGLDPALRIAQAALGAGRRLVTANKALVAAHGPRLAALARRTGARLDFESAVGGGVPVIRALRDSLALTGIVSVRGILNGTTNYVLTRLGEGWRYADALAEAQARGFAEADPERDVSGQDAADKLRILAWLAFGVDPSALPVRRRGIVPEPDRLARAAAVAGGVPRLLAEAVVTADGVAASVEPVVVAASSEFGRARDEENVVTVRSEWNGTVRLSGPGAGGAATASALLGDVVRGAQRPPRTLAPAPVVAADRRAHRWVIGLAGRCTDERFLARTLERAGVAAESIARAEGEVFVRTGALPWSRVDLATRMLEGAGCAPVVARVEVG
jgi:homoserine dehydrogenase